MSSNLTKLEHSISVHSPSAFNQREDSILRNTLMEIRLNSKNGILSFKAIQITFPTKVKYTRKRPVTVR